MSNKVSVSSFYKFFKIEPSELAVKRLSLESRAAKLELYGLLILAEEGCNGTIAGDLENVLAFQKSLAVLFGIGDWDFKNSHCLKAPYRDFRVKIRPEIVTIRTDELIKVEGSSRKLSPSKWQQVLETEEDLVLIDTRNEYETALGMFKGAIDPQMENFSDFPDYVASSGIPKEKKILMYCTGGIRCEKAALEMQRQGYENVFQLEGGILKYLEEFPNCDFEGECFVFDGRVALDQNLNPTRRWKFCPHCGQPGEETISCDFCGKQAVVCQECLAMDKLTCSHDCAYKVLHHPSRKSVNSSDIQLLA